jgi:hypothetical protein
MAPAVVNVNAIVEARRPERLEQIDVTARSQNATVWVTERTSRLGAPETHDALLRSACDPLDALEPIPVLVPATGAPGMLTRLSEIAEADCARVTRICPATHSYPLADWVLSPIPEICERHHLALLIDFDVQPPPWSEVVAFARRFPSVPMVLLADALDREHAAPAALDVTANLLLQLTPDCARAPYLVSTFGPARFVCGSRHGVPVDSGEAWHALDGMGDDDRDAVLAGNARLLATGTYAGKFL